MNEPKYIPHNVVEYENTLRSIIIAHMGLSGGNPSQWVVDAANRAFEAGFANGWLIAQPSGAQGPQVPDWWIVHAVCDAYMKGLMQAVRTRCGTEPQPPALHPEALGIQQAGRQERRPAVRSDDQRRIGTMRINPDITDVD